MSQQHQHNPMSFDDINQRLRPVAEIDLNNLEPEVLAHLRDQLGLLAHQTGLRIDDQITERRATTMSANIRSIPGLNYCAEDFGSFNTAMSAPASHRVEIDLRTRLILKALLNDFMAAREIITSLTDDVDALCSIQVPISVLAGLVEGHSPLQLATACQKKAYNEESEPAEEPLSLHAADSDNYQPGDFVRALREGLKHENLIDEIESMMVGLLFHRGENSTHVARNLLFDLLSALDAPQ